MAYDDRRGSSRGRSPYNSYRDSSRRRGPQGSRRSARVVNDLFHTDLDREKFSRWLIVPIVFAVFLCAGLLKLVDYDIINVQTYRDRADMYRLASETIYAKRGTIYDRNGNVLAVSVDCVNVYVNSELVDDPKETAEALAEKLDMEEKDVRAIIDQGGAFCYVKRQVDQELADEIEALELPGVGFEQAVKRVYPYGSLASQVLGVVNNENQGLTGIELFYNDLLSGENGSLMRERSMDGSYIAGGAYFEEPAVDGTDIVLTIDVNIQATAEDSLEAAVEDSEAENGSVVVLDPRSGEILAACSNPTYDPDDLESATSEDMNLRVVTDSYEPGSTFKIITSAIAIELGIMDTDKPEISVPGAVKVGDDYVTDADGRSETMDMSLREMLRRSSNTGFALVGAEIGADDYVKYLDLFDIGEKTGIDFPGEIEGIVTDRDDYDGSTLSTMAFGQAVSVPPIQVARAGATVANDGVATTPHFLLAKGGEQAEWKDEEKRVIDKQTAEDVADIMTDVVESGTGTDAAIEGYEISGKTGTAEIASETGGYLDDTYMTSFLGFGPTKDPKVLTYVTLYGTAGVTVSQDVFRTVESTAFQTMGVTPTA